jgi:uncharacterized protein
MILRDPVHGLIAFEAEEDAIVPMLLQTREVQRLRRIRQLGLTSLAFPGAEHTRFSHALGSAHVMQRFLQRIRRIDGELPFWQRVTSERARDATAAALLHDLGHGPLSHTFEEVIPGAYRHERWTSDILLDPDSEVHQVLVHEDPHLPRRVASLIDGQHELAYLARAVSGTFDVDRCDYLLRDAHATGVRYGDYDLAWLLRSLRFAPSNGSGSEAPGLAIDGLKGLTAIESFLLARQFMFQQVYFHKSTRAAEFMLGAILRRAIQLIVDGTRLPARIPALETIASGRRPTITEFLSLDDQALLGALVMWEDSTDPVLSDLCKRLRARRLFKTIELGTETEPHLTADQALEVGREIARTNGLDPSLYVGIDSAGDTPYSEDESLSVVFPSGATRRPGDVSFLLGRLRGATFTRTRVIFAPELRTSIRDALPCA